VGAALPVIVGLLGALSYAVTDKNVRALAARDEINKILASSEHYVSDEAKTKIGKVLEADWISTWLIPLWAAHVFLFCVTTFLGVLWGSSARRAEHTSTESEFAALVAQHHLEANPNNPPPTAQICLLFHLCKKAGWQRHEINDLFGSVKKSIVDRALSGGDAWSQVQKMAEVIASWKGESSRHIVQGN